MPNRRRTISSAVGIATGGSERRCGHAAQAASGASALTSRIGAPTDWSNTREANSQRRPAERAELEMKRIHDELEARAEAKHAEIESMAARTRVSAGAIAAGVQQPIVVAELRTQKEALERQRRRIEAELQFAMTRHALEAREATHLREYERCCSSRVRAAVLEARARPRTSRRASASRHLRHPRASARRSASAPRPPPTRTSRHCTSTAAATPPPPPPAPDSPDAAASAPTASAASPDFARLRADHG